LAVHEGLMPVVGAAPYDVLSRQLPRQLVQMLNDGEDRGVRFLPLLGKVDGRRAFLGARQLISIGTLQELYRAGDAQLLVDGIIQQDSLRVRIVDAGSGSVHREIECPFSPLQPLPALQQIWFEVTSVLGWTGRPSAPDLPQGPALGWLMVARDELLAIEAGIEREAEVDVLRAARECVGVAPTNMSVVSVAIETAAHLVRQGVRSAEAAQLLDAVGRTAADDVALLKKVGGLLQALSAEAEAAAVWTRIAGLEPSAEAVETAAALWFRAGDAEQAHALLTEMRGRGQLEVGGLGQLAAVADRLGDLQLRDEVTEELLQQGPLPSSVARLLITFLLEGDGAAKARRIAEQALVEAPDDATLWLDLGRACLMLDDCDAARSALQRCRDSGIGSGEVRQDLGRLLRLCEVPGLFATMRRVEEALTADEPRQALRLARLAKRRTPDVAEAWLFLGIVRHRLGHDRRAERAFVRAVELDEQLADAHNRLGILRVARGDAVKGYEHLLRAQQLEPDDPSTQLHLAQACALLKRMQDGAEHLERARLLGANPRLFEAVRVRFFAKGA
jgi:tetratricopeptide (TPR) repeat protein